MKRPVSVFIMDITRSSSGDWHELSDYLQHWEKTIAEWCDGTIAAHVSHRRGDEILFVGDHAFSAYTVAQALAVHWKFREHPPYFGLAHGMTEETLEDLDIEIWNPPMIKRAREMADQMKRMKVRRTTMLCGEERPSDVLITLSDIVNLLIENQLALWKRQSEQQKLIYALSTVFHEQKTVARLLNKTASTVSIHYNRGRSDLLMKNSDRIQKLLASGETALNGSDRVARAINLLNHSIQTQIARRIQDYYPFIGVD